MNDPTWTILIPTLGQRSEQLRSLLDVLLPQTDAYGPRVRVMALWNNGEYPLPTIRQTMVEATSSDYLCFVDDDDMIPDYYVSEVMKALDSRPDYVGWIVQYRPGQEHARLCYHSLKYGGWFEKTGSLYRDISHINPIRTDVAKRVDFKKTRQFRAEDRVWVDQVRALRTLKREVYIDQIMYYYRYSHTQSDTWRYPGRIKKGPFEPLDVRHPNFDWFRGDVMTPRAHYSQRSSGPRARRLYSSR